MKDEQEKEKKGVLERTGAARMPGRHSFPQKKTKGGKGARIWGFEDKDEGINNHNENMAGIRSGVFFPSVET
jgi:hypothetical protein